MECLTCDAPYPCGCYDPRYSCGCGFETSATCLDNVVAAQRKLGLDTEPMCPDCFVDALAS